MSKTNCQSTLPFHPDRKMTVSFDGGEITSDAGLALLYCLDRSQGISRGFAGCLSDTRDQRYITHTLEEMTAQRMLQIAAGYEDCNDADALRHDAGLKSFCNRLPESDGDLASGPTLSRMENAAARRDLWRALERLRDQYLLKLKRSGRRQVVLDLDSTDDPTHGQQEFTFYHGYFKSHVYHPLLIFDAESADLVTALLRAGNRGAAYRAVPVLARLIPAIRQRIKQTPEVEIRADSGFATPQIYEYCEGEQLTYVIGFNRNPRLEAAVEELVVEGRQAYEQEGVKQRLFTEFPYQADSWDRPRRMVAKVEVTEKGVNRRFVVTNREDLSPQALYEHYTRRGQSENYIKAFKKDLQMDRLSCHRFLANQFRLLLLSASAC